MPKRRLVIDERARVPFAMVAVLILMLSVFSITYLSGIQSQEVGRRLQGAETSRQNSILHQVEERMALEGFYIATMAVSSSTQFLCNETMLDACFSENYSAYLVRSFPVFIDPYRVEVRDFRSSVFLEERSLRDLTPSNATETQNMTLNDESGTEAEASVEVLDTVTGEEIAETSALARYVVVGYGNCTVRNVRSGAAMERPISFEKSIDSPFPLMSSKMSTLDSAGKSDAMGLARAVKYILTTLAQFRVLEGYGSGITSTPGMTADIVTMEDVQLAVNLAVLLESARLFRSYDADVLAGLDSLGLGADGLALHSLFEDYITSGTLDPADIISLYKGLGDKVIPVDLILAQALNAIADQFILKYLDYFGITEIVNEIYKAAQKLSHLIEDVGKTLSNFIFGDDGENREGAEQVSDWITKMSKSISWPPEAAGYSDLVIGNPFASVTDLAVLDVLQPVNGVFHYTGNCSQLLSETSSQILDSDGAVIGESRLASIRPFNVSSDTLSSAAAGYPLGYLADFQPVSIVRQSSGMISLWSDFYEQSYAANEDVIYDTVRDAVKNVTAEIALIITTFVGQNTLTLSGYAGGVYSIDPKDRTSVLEDTRDMIAQVVDDTTAHLQANPGMVESMLAVLTSKQSRLTLDFMEFVSLNYDTIVNKPARLEDAISSLSRSMLSNSTISSQAAATFSTTYFVYNSLGYAKGFTDSPLPFNCTHVPDTAVLVRVLAEQNRQALGSDIQASADSAYSRLKSAESEWMSFDHPGNGLYMKALEDNVHGTSKSIFLQFIGLGDSNFIGMARDMVVHVLDGIIWGGEMSNVQYAPELVFSDSSAPVPFEMYEGGYADALSAGKIWHENLTAVLPDGLILVTPETGQSDQMPRGSLSVAISGPTGVHYTNAVTFNERPFENRWDVSIKGVFRLSLSSSSLPYVGNGTHSPAAMERDIEIDLDISVLAYSGWDLSGVEYSSTATLAGDVAKLLDIIAAFFEWVWNTIAGPINWLIDQVMRMVGFFTDIIGTLLGYASDVMDLAMEAISFLVETAQTFLRDVAGWVFDLIVDWVIDLMPDGISFNFNMFGLDLLVAFGSDADIASANSGNGGTLMTISTSCDKKGSGFDIELELLCLPDDVAASVGMEYDLILSSDIDILDFNLITVIDPFMAHQEYIVECRGNGDGWGMELLSPVVESYDSVQYSLHDIPGVGAALSNIPIPFLGVKASVNAGLEIIYTLRGLEADHPVINEVELNPKGDDAGNQWVELYNPTDSEFSLDNWTLGSSKHPDLNRTLNSTAMLDPGGYFVVRYLNQTLQQGPADFELRDPGGRKVDSAPSSSEPDNGMASGIPVGPSGGQMTWQRSPNGADLAVAGEWVFGNGTIGSENAAIDIEFRTLAMNLLKNAFNTTWHSLKDELALSLDFIVKLITQFIQRFIDDALHVIARSVVETSLFIDVMLTDVSGTGGGGITLSFVIEGGDTLASILRWVIGSVSAFLARFGKPAQPAQYPRLGEDVPEHLFIRLDFYGMVQVPKMVKVATQREAAMDPVKLAGRIEANIPALAALVGKDMGRWKINFGAYIDKMPAAIADPLFGTGESTPDVWLFKGSVFET